MMPAMNIKIETKFRQDRHVTIEKGIYYESSPKALTFGLDS